MTGVSAVRIVRPNGANTRMRTCDKLRNGDGEALPLFAKGTLIFRWRGGGAGVKIKAVGLRARKAQGLETWVDFARPPWEDLCRYA